MLLNKRVFEEVIAENVDKTGIYAIVWVKEGKNLTEFNSCTEKGALKLRENVS